MSLLAALPAMPGTAVTAFPGSNGSGRPLITAVYPYPSDPTGVSLGAQLTPISGLGAKMVRILVVWASVAPLERPASWQPADPTDPNYRWDVVDRELKLVVAKGLQPIIDVLAAPTWAQAAPAGAGLISNRPDATQLGLFAEALARRYGGGVPGLPIVRYFEVWNEPDLSIYLTPQLVADSPVSPGVYRAMVNAFADAVHGVDPDNVVIAGELAPFRDITPVVLAQRKDWAPLTFMRDFLCLSKSLRRTCSAHVSFDVWSVHPYTSGDPSHHAAYADEVSLGDLGEVTKVLAAARALHVIRAPRGVGFWVTEFSWDSNPPDPKGVPVSYLERWVPEALYTMWKDGVSVVTWFTLSDFPLATSYFQSGLYFRSAGADNGKIKPYAEGFRFPFVAYPQGTGLFVWGRNPRSRAAIVRVRQNVGSSWRVVATLRSNAFGIFTGTVPRRGAGDVQAQIAATGEKSLPFSLKPLPDRFFNPFGLPTLLDPPHAAKP
jgi:hypothetical protein